MDDILDIHRFACDDMCRGRSGFCFSKTGRLEDEGLSAYISHPPLPLSPTTLQIDTFPIILSLTPSYSTIRTFSNTYHSLIYTLARRSFSSYSTAETDTYLSQPKQPISLILLYLQCRPTG